MKKGWREALDDLGGGWASYCITCVHTHAGPTCDAFPDGIPDEILFNLVDHRKPYPGDHGIRYEPAPGYEDSVDQGMEDRRQFDFIVKRLYGG